MAKRLTHKVIVKGDRELTITPNRYSPDDINIMVDDKLENVYRGIDVNKNELLAALIEVGALDEFLSGLTVENLSS